MGARWDQAPHVATRTRLSMAALLARLLRNARTFGNWCGRRASCSCSSSNLRRNQAALRPAFKGLMGSALLRQHRLHALQAVMNTSLAVRTSALSSLTLSEPHARLGVIEKFNS